MSKKGKGNSSLGRTLIKDRFGHTNRRKVDNDSMVCKLHRNKKILIKLITFFILFMQYIVAHHRDSRWL